MKTMLLAFITIGVIAFGADYALNSDGFSAQLQSNGSNVRLD